MNNRSRVSYIYADLLKVGGLMQNMFVWRKVVIILSDYKSWGWGNCLSCPLVQSSLNKDDNNVITFVMLKHQ